MHEVETLFVAVKNTHFILQGHSLKYFKFQINKTLYEHFRRWVIKAYCAINLIYRMFNSRYKSAWLVNLWSSLPCNDYVTTFCEIKQVVHEWAEFSYKAMFTCSYLSGLF